MEVIKNNCSMSGGVIAIHPLSSVGGGNNKGGVEVKGSSGLTGARSSVEYKDKGLVVSGGGPSMFIRLEAFVVSEDGGEVGFVFRDGPELFSRVNLPLNVDKIVSLGLSGGGSPGGEVRDCFHVSETVYNVQLIIVPAFFFVAILSRLFRCSQGTFKVGTLRNELFDGPKKLLILEGNVALALSGMNDYHSKYLEMWCSTFSHLGLEGVEDDLICFMRM